MAKKRNYKKSIYSDKLIYTNRIDIYLTEENEYNFEIGDIATNDILEGIVLCMIHEKDNSEVWNITINKENISEINPIKSLYWITGGDKEWNTLSHYNMKWSNTYQYFNDEYSILLIEIILHSKTFSDVKRHIIENLNMIDIYEFSLQNELIKINYNDI